MDGIDRVKIKTLMGGYGSQVSVEDVVFPREFPLAGKVIVVFAVTFRVLVVATAAMVVDVLFVKATAFVVLNSHILRSTSQFLIFILNEPTA